MHPETSRDDRDAPQSSSLSEPTGVTCPLDPGWRLWTMFHNRFDKVPPETAERINAARRAIAGQTVLSTYPTWEIADDDACHEPMTIEESGDVQWRFGATSPWHLHTELTVEGSVVHVDTCGATRYGPGSFWVETRIHVDGELRGRSGHCGCSLGGGSIREDKATAILERHVVEVYLQPDMRDAALKGTIHVRVCELYQRGARSRQG
jgi:hypothetical protein